ncbi:MAG TPA: hypothetical protein RMH99_22520 [Sandaracinaceae bacterium LLY-WYZ-13_1]|nr:hypothetical protein [Sandaracinaceae bacterium LLY-WYZ-13_1]
MDPAEMTLDQLWEAEGEAPERTPFDPSLLADQPEPMRRYLEHAIAPGTPLARAVRLEMEGEIKLGDRWRPFEAEQVIRWDRGFIWKADTKMAPGVHVKGSDRLVDGVGAMDWRLLGFVPVMSASGPDIARSSAGRLEAETIWLPSVLLDDDVRWRVEDGEHLQVAVHVAGDEGRLRFTLGDDGRLTSVELPRWGDPEGANFHLVPFGGIVEAEDTFEGYTVPTKVRVGWYFGRDRFETDGEFFRAQVTRLRYR